MSGSSTKGGSFNSFQIYIYIPSFCKFENRLRKPRVVVLRDPERLKAIGIFSFQILETLGDYRNLFVFFNTENLKRFFKMAQKTGSAGFHKK